MDGGRNSILIYQKKVWRICVTKKVSKHGKRNATKGTVITICPSRWNDHYYMIIL